MFIYLLEASCCIMLFYVVYIMFYKPHTNHRYNRFYLLAAIILSFLIPWIEIITHVETISLIPQLIPNISTNVAVKSSPITVQNILTTLYFIGVLISLSIFIFKLLKLYFIIRKGEQKYVDGYKIVSVNEKMGICSFLNYIIIPKQNNIRINQFELSHEKSHINQFHSLDIIIAWLFQSIFWFNPIAYLFKLRLMEVHEFLADKDTIKLNGKSDYQEYILGILSQKLQPKLVHNFNSIIKTRLTMMNSNSNPSKWSYGVTSAVLLLAVFFFSCHKKSIAQIQKAEKSNIEWLTGISIDTIITIDYDTYEETVEIVKNEYQYVMDTTVVIDYDTYEERIAIVKAYKEDYKFLNLNKYWIKKED